MWRIVLVTCIVLFNSINIVHILKNYKLDMERGKSVDKLNKVSDKTILAISVVYQIIIFIGILNKNIDIYGVVELISMSVVTIAIVSDFRFYQVANRVTLILLALGAAEIAYSVVNTDYHWIEQLLYMVIVVIINVILLIYNNVRNAGRTELLGMGDIKLIIGMSVSISGMIVMWSWFLATIIGAVYYLVIKIMYKEDYDKYVPYACFIGIANIAVYLVFMVINNINLGGFLK